MFPSNFETPFRISMTQEEDQNCASLDYIFAHRGDKTAF